MNYTNVKKFIQKFNEDDENEDKNDDKEKVSPLTHIFVAGGKFQTMKYQSYCEHTGNEAAPAEHTYVSIILCCKRKKEKINII
jgi:hypothetical protein